jgi:tetratricopeptide (TPR) repeat protein
MSVNRFRTLAPLAALLALAMVSGGCGVINKLRAKNSLNEGVREYNKGKYDLAEAKFKLASDLSPDLTNARLFYAQTLYQEYDQHRTEDMANRVINAYQDIIDKSKDNPQQLDRGLAFQADVLDKMRKAAEEKGEEGKARAEQLRQQYHQILEQRADLPGASAETKAAVYYSIGQSYWSDAFKISRSYVNFDGTLKQPIPPDKAAQMKPAIDKALEYLNKALGFNPDYADVWTIKKLSLMQENFITTDPARQKALKTQIDEADKKAKSLYEKRKADAAQANAQTAK